MPRRFALPLIAALPLLVAAPAHAVTAKQAVAACPSAAAAPSPANVEQLERTTLCLVNLERTHRDLPRLRGNGDLARAAAAHSEDMVRRDFFSHVSPGGGTLLTRVKSTGYLGGARGYTVGENIAWGTGSLGTPLRIMRSWMDSPGHRANILNGSFRELGVGVAYGAPRQDGGATYTTDFGARG